MTKLNIDSAFSNIDDAIRATPSTDEIEQLVEKPHRERTKVQINRILEDCSRWIKGVLPYLQTLSSITNITGEDATGIAPKEKPILSNERIREMTDHLDKCLSENENLRENERSLNATIVKLRDDLKATEAVTDERNALRRELEKLSNKYGELEIVNTQLRDRVQQHAAEIVDLKAKPKPLLHRLLKK